VKLGSDWHAASTIISLETLSMETSLFHIDAIVRTSRWCEALAAATAVDAEEGRREGGMEGGKE
jgi:hypothetical protein